mgnify:FL=1
MTLETVNTDRRVSMTTAAEVIVTADPGIFVVLVRSDMTINAFGQAVLLGSYAIMHGIVTLVKQVLHVIFPDVIEGFHARLFLAETCLCWRHDR